MDVGLVGEMRTSDGTTTLRVYRQNEDVGPRAVEHVSVVLDHTGPSRFVLEKTDAARLIDLLRSAVSDRR